jgi:hypothetical protein
MEYGAQAAPVSKGRLWAGRILSGIAVLFMLFDTIIHAMKPPAVERVRALIPLRR